MVALIVLMALKLTLTCGLDNVKQHETDELLSILRHIKTISSSDYLKKPWIRRPSPISDEPNSVFPDHNSIQPRFGILNIIKKVADKVINTKINHLPFELHLPGYQFCGPGTKIEERLNHGDKGINKLDEACREHDIAYLMHKDIKHREEADSKLVKVAWDIYQNDDLSLGQRMAAYLVFKIHLVFTFQIM